MGFIALLFFSTQYEKRYGGVTTCRTENLIIQRAGELLDTEM